MGNVRYLGIDVDGAREIAERTEVWLPVVTAAVRRPRPKVADRPQPDVWSRSPKQPSTIEICSGHPEARVPVAVVAYWQVLRHCAANFILVIRIAE